MKPRNIILLLVLILACHAFLVGFTSGKDNAHIEAQSELIEYQSKQIDSLKGVIHDLWIREIHNRK